MGGPDPLSVTLDPRMWSLICYCDIFWLYSGSYMSDHVLLNLLNQLVKTIQCEACQAFYHFFTTSLIDSVI